MFAQLNQIKLKRIVWLLMTLKKLIKNEYDVEYEYQSVRIITMWNKVLNNLYKTNN